MTRNVLDRLNDESLVALCVRGADWPRGLLSDTPVPDKWMGLAEHPDGRRRFVPAGETPRLSAADRLTLVRNRPIAVALHEPDCPAAGGHDIRATGEILVRWGAREDDLAALRRTLLHDDALTLARLAAALLDDGLRAALYAFIRTGDATALVGHDVRDEALRFLLQDESVRRFAFETGLSIERIAKLDFHSEGLAHERAAQRDAQRRVERIQAREMVEQAALAATRRRLGDLAGVMEKLKAASAADSNLRWHDLLPALSPAERGRLLENLWRLTPDRRKTAAIVAVAGDKLLWIAPGAPDRIERQVSLPDDLGGLRCAIHCRQRDWLMVGAARGVWALHAQSGEIAARFEVPGVEPPRTGFNAVAVVADRLFATHSALGCWSWPLSAPTDGRAILEPQAGVPRSIRCATTAEEVCVAVASARPTLLLAADDCLHTYDPAADELTAIGTADDVIHSVAVLENQAFVGTAGGRLMQLDLRRPDDWWQAYRVRGAIESISPRRWTDLVELVIPAGPEGVLGLYVEENVTVRLLDAPLSIRRAWAADDCVVGLADSRDRLIVMDTNSPDRRGREAPIARLTGHSIQDACLVPELQMKNAE